MRLKRCRCVNNEAEIEYFQLCSQHVPIFKKALLSLSLNVRVLGHQKQVGPELFRVFYTIWKETEAEAQEVCLKLRQNY